MKKEKKRMPHARKCVRLRNIGKKKDVAEAKRFLSLALRSLG
jgi:hypothetical protein